MKYRLFTSNSDRAGSSGRLALRLAVFVALAFAGQVAVYECSNAKIAPLSGGDMNLLNLSAEEWSPITLGTLDGFVATKPEIVYMVASTAFPMPVDREDRRSTPEMLAALLPGYRIERFCAGALTAEYYQLFLDYLIARDAAPRLAIVTVNPRSFGIAWYRNPWFQFQYLRLFLRHDSYGLRVLWQPLSVFKTFNLLPIPFETYQAEMREAYVETAMRLYGEARVPTYPELTFPEQQLLMYGYELGPEHPLVQSLFDMAARAREANIEIVFYITPIGTGHLEQLHGPQMVSQFCRNIAWLTSAMRERGMDVLDLSEAAPDSDVFPILGTVSHLKTAGRLEVARRLAEHLQEEGRLDGLGAR